MAKNIKYVSASSSTNLFCGNVEFFIFDHCYRTKWRNQNQKWRYPYWRPAHPVHWKWAKSSRFVQSKPNWSHSNNVLMILLSIRPQTVNRRSYRGINTIKMAMNAGPAAQRPKACGTIVPGANTHRRHTISNSDTTGDRFQGGAIFVFLASSPCNTLAFCIRARKPLQPIDGTKSCRRHQCSSNFFSSFFFFLRFLSFRIKRRFKLVQISSTIFKPSHLWFVLF